MKRDVEYCIWNIPVLYEEIKIEGIPTPGLGIVWISIKCFKKLWYFLNKQIILLNLISLITVAAELNTELLTSGWRQDKPGLNYQYIWT